MVKSLLGPEKVKPTFISRSDAVGIANGLAWTSVGGEMLPVEVSVVPGGSGKIELTGSLGDVMKESAQLAVTYARVHAQQYGIAGRWCSRIPTSTSMRPRAPCAQETGLRPA